jgi:hypothetical protein
LKEPGNCARQINHRPTGTDANKAQEMPESFVNLGSRLADESVLRW